MYIKEKEPQKKENSFKIVGNTQSIINCLPPTSSPYHICPQLWQGGETHDIVYTDNASQKVANRPFWQSEAWLPCLEHNPNIH